MKSTVVLPVVVTLILVLVVILDMIWYVSAKGYFLEELIQIYYLEIWIYLVRYLTQDLRPFTLSFIRPVYLKIVYHKCEAFLCDLLLDMRFVLALYHTPYVYLATNNHTPHPARECPVLAHLGPNKESVHEHLLAVRSSGPGIEVHYLYNGQTNFTPDIKWISFDVIVLAK